MHVTRSPGRNVSQGNIPQCQIKNAGADGFESPSPSDCVDRCDKLEALTMNQADHIPPTADAGGMPQEQRSRADTDQPTGEGPYQLSQRNQETRQSYQQQAPASEQPQQQPLSTRSHPSYAATNPCPLTCGLPGGPTGGSQQSPAPCPGPVGRGRPKTNLGPQHNSGSNQQREPERQSNSQPVSRWDGHRCSIEFRFPVATEEGTEMEVETGPVLRFPAGGGAGKTGGPYRKGCPAVRTRDWLAGCRPKGPCSIVPVWFATAFALLAALGQLLSFSLPLWASNRANVSDPSVRDDPFGGSGTTKYYHCTGDTDTGAQPEAGSDRDYGLRPASIVHVKYKTPPEVPAQGPEHRISGNEAKSPNLTATLYSSMATNSAGKAIGNKSSLMAAAGGRIAPAGGQPLVTTRPTLSEGRIRNKSASHGDRALQAPLQQTGVTTGARPPVLVTLGLWNICRHGACQMICFQKLPGRL